MNVQESIVSIALGNKIFRVGTFVQEVAQKIALCSGLSRQECDRRHLHSRSNLSLWVPIILRVIFMRKWL